MVNYVYKSYCFTFLSVIPTHPRFIIYLDPARMIIPFRRKGCTVLFDTYVYFI